MKYRAYPSYKPSGVEWLGDLPDHWKLGPFKSLFRFVSGGTPSTTVAEYWEGDIPWISAKDVKQLYLDDTEDHIAELAVAESATTMLPKCSLVIVARSGILRRSLPVAITTRPMSINQDIKGCVPTKKGDIRYFAYLLHGNQSPLLSIWRQQGATVESLAVETMRSAYLPVPSVTEQLRIADYLDRETAKIDKLIAKKRELIERMNEKRTALISHVVTKGLPPEEAAKHGLPINPPLKPSGVPWLGDIPAHWGVVPLRYLFKSFDHQRIPLAGEVRATMEKTYPYYGASGVIDHVEDYLFEETLILVGEDGANLLSRSTPLAFLASGKYWVNNHAHILKPLWGSIAFWVSALETFDYAPLVTGAAQPKLTADRLGSILLPAPPPGEQTAISKYIDEQSSKVSMLITAAQAAIEFLQEYRSGLITAAVTGKIDVREEETF